MTGGCHVKPDGNILTAPASIGDSHPTGHTRRGATGQISDMAGRILLIEDEANIAEALRFLLTRDGWQVETHADGATATALIRTLLPDVVILDVMLPGRSGYEILDDLRADPALKSLPVLILTARGQDRERAQAAARGASLFMTKPFANADLLAGLRTLVPER